VRRLGVDWSDQTSSGGGAGPVAGVGPTDLKSVGLKDGVPWVPSEKQGKSGSWRHFIDASKDRFRGCALC
jgi:hypothetical protein